MYYTGAFSVCLLQLYAMQREGCKAFSVINAHLFTLVIICVQVLRSGETFKSYCLCIYTQDVPKPQIMLADSMFKNNERVYLKHTKCVSHNTAPLKTL